MRKMSYNYPDPMAAGVSQNVVAAEIAQVEATSNSAYYIGIAALIMAIIAIIIIIVVAYLLYSGNNVVDDSFRSWNINTAVATNNSWVAAPNSMLLVPTNIPATGYTVTILPFSNINLSVANSRTSIFIIDNTLSATQSVTVVGSSGITVQGNPVIAPGTAAEFVWISPTAVRRLILGATATA